MSTEVKRRRGTAAEHETFTGAVGEVTVVTDESGLRVHDGVTAGGKPVASIEDANAGDSQLAGGYIWPLSSQKSLALGAQSTSVDIGVTRLRVNTGLEVEILYLWEPSGDFGSSARTITDISSNDFGGYDVVTTAGTFEFVTSIKHAARSVYDVFGYGFVINDSSLPQRDLNSAALERCLTENGQANLANVGEYWIAANTEVSGGRISGVPRGPGDLSNSFIMGDGDLFNITSSMFFSDFSIGNDTTRGRLFRDERTQAVGRVSFSNVVMFKATTHVEVASDAAVDWVFRDCSFGYHEFASRSFVGLWAYTEIACYTWQGNYPTSHGLVIGEGNAITNSIYGSVYELISGHAIKYTSSVVTGQINAMLISATHFEKNGSNAGESDVLVEITGPTRGRCVTLQSCGFFSASTGQNYRVEFTNSGGGSNNDHLLIGCQSQPGTQLVNNTSNVTVLACDQSGAFDFGDNVNQVVTTKGTAGLSYDAGTWTATDDSGAGVSITTSNGRWERRGNLVTVTGKLSFGATADTTASTIGGLPFAAEDEYAASVGYSDDPTLYDAKVRTNTSATRFRIYKGANSRALNSDIASKSFYINLTYRI